MNWTNKSRPATARPLLGALAVVLTLGLTVPAAADEEDADDQQQQQDQRLFLVPADGLEGEVSDIVTERINETVRERIETLEGVELVPPFEAFYGEAQGEVAAAAVSEAERQYTSGIGLVNAGEYEAAVETLERAVEVFEENIAAVDDIDLIADAKANLAIAYHETGFDLDARDAIEHFAQLNPDADLDPDDFPAALRELYDEEVGRVEAAGDGHLNIAADREGAQVYINTELKGETPLTVDDVGFGEHYMVVRHEDIVWSDTVQVRARGQEQDIDINLSEADEEDDEADDLPSYYVDFRDTLRSGQFGRNLDPYLDELASETGAEFIAWILVVPDGRDYAAAPFIYRADDQVVIQTDNVVFDGELSDVRSRADQLAGLFGAAVVHMPEDQRIDRVDLVEQQDRPVADLEEQPEEEPEAVEEPVEPEDEEPEVAEAEDQEVARADEQHPEEELPVPDETADAQEVGDPMPDQPTDERSNTRRYLGWGGVAAAATGALAGTVFLLARDSGPDQPGFDVEVEW